MKWPVTGRSTDATRYCPARYSYTRSPSASRFAPCAMSASTVPDIDGDGGVGRVDLRDQDAVDGGGPVGPRVAGEQLAQLVEVHARE